MTRALRRAGWTSASDDSDAPRPRLAICAGRPDADAPRRRAPGKTRGRRRVRSRAGKQNRRVVQIGRRRRSRALRRGPSPRRTRARGSRRRARRRNLADGGKSRNVRRFSAGRASRPSRDARVPRVRANARVRSRVADDASSSFDPSAPAAALVVGGVGALGAKTAEWFVARGGATRVILTGRTGRGSARGTLRSLADVSAVVVATRSDASTAEGAEAAIRAVAATFATPGFAVAHAGRNARRRVPRRASRRRRSRRVRAETERRDASSLVARRRRGCDRRVRRVHVRRGALRIPGINPRHSERVARPPRAGRARRGTRSRPYSGGVVRGVWRTRGPSPRDTHGSRRGVARGGDSRRSVERRRRVSSIPPRQASTTQPPPVSLRLDRVPRHLPRQARAAVFDDVIVAEETNGRTRSPAARVATRRRHRRRRTRRRHLVRRRTRRRRRVRRPRASFARWPPWRWVPPIRSWTAASILWRA